ncbi:hypothetical protein Tco_0366997 [Tanacetum coccineum]
MGRILTTPFPYLNSFHLEVGLVKSLPSSMAFDLLAPSISVMDHVKSRIRGTIDQFGQRQSFCRTMSLAYREAGDEAKEAGSVKSSATENKDHEMTVEKEEEFKKLKKKPKKKRIITGHFDQLSPL